MLAAWAPVAMPSVAVAAIPAPVITLGRVLQPLRFGGSCRRSRRLRRCRFAISAPFCRGRGPLGRLHNACYSEPMVSARQKSGHQLQRQAFRLPLALLALWTGRLLLALLEGPGALSRGACG